MPRNKPAILALVAAGTLLGGANAQTIFSPSQADFLNLEFADFIDNVEDDMAALIGITPVTDPELGPAADIEFRTDFDINDELFRVAMETPYDDVAMTGDFSQDLTGLEAFQITFSNPQISPPEISNIAAQIYLRSDNNTVFTGSGPVTLNANNPVTASIPTSAITANGGSLANITSFGIEFFGGDEFAGGLNPGIARASTTPQPPELVDTVLYSWEDGTLQGWDSPPIVEGAHTHTVLAGSPGAPAFGATDGVNSLQIERDFSNGASFAWGTAVTLDAFADPGGPPPGDYNADTVVDAADYVVWRNGDSPDSTRAGFDTWADNYGAAEGAGDPEVLAEIQEFADAINAEDAYSLAFDLTIQDQFPNTNPGFMSVFLSIAVDDQNETVNDPFYQAPQFDVPLGDLAEPVTVTVEYLLSSFEDVGDGDQGFLSDNGIVDNAGYLTVNFASNATITDGLTFSIDNFRIRNVAPAAGNAVPEPTAALLAGLALAAAAAGRRVDCIGRAAIDAPPGRVGPGRRTVA